LPDWKTILKSKSDSAELWITAISKLKDMVEEQSDLGDLEIFKYIDVYIYKLGNHLQINESNDWTKGIQAARELSGDVSEFGIFRYIDDLIRKIKL
jgi:hypothetical protein